MPLKKYLHPHDRKENNKTTKNWIIFNDIHIGKRKKTMFQYIYMKGDNDFIDDAPICFCWRQLFEVKVWNYS